MSGLKVGFFELSFDVCLGTPIESGESLFLFVGLCFHYIPIAATTFCPPPSSYLRKGLCNLAER